MIKRRTFEISVDGNFVQAESVYDDQHDNPAAVFVSLLSLAVSQKMGSGVLTVQVVTEEA